MNTSEKILHWYAKNARDLPWRGESDPYKIWVSEIMLQQTQVSRVIEYYHRFLKKFPTVQILSQHSWEEMLPFWRGLGFYSRGKNMLRTAKTITSQHGGIFPKTRASLMSLSGIGPYTASAILSFAFGESCPAIDTNLERILQRRYGCTKADIQSRADSLFQETGNNAPLLNHALMDLGSSLCKGRRTHCEICPLQDECHFVQSGKQEEWEQQIKTQTKAKRKAGQYQSSQKILMEVAIACIHHNGKYLIAQRTKGKGGLWEFPGGKREKGEDWRHCLQREIQEELGVEISVRPHFCEEVWEEGDFLWRLRFSRCQILRGTPQEKEHARLAWVLPQELVQYPFPSANQKALTFLQTMKMTEEKE